MRTTVTLESDVSALLKRMEKERGTKFKTLINTVLREGIAAMSHAKPRASTFKSPTCPQNLGKPLVDDLSDTGEILSIIDGDQHR